jgi:putative ABC transport system ATP-binding protein
VSGAQVVVANVTKTFDGGRIIALADVSLDVAPGELVSLTGPSGSGKSTLLNLVGSLDGPDSGSITVDGRRLDGIDTAAYRAETVGFVFQFHHLIPTISAIDNVQVPMLGRGRDRVVRERTARALLGEVGLSGRAGAVPATLSGGERQRVAIARALANDPRLLLADEPTGALDSETGAQVLSLLRRLRGERGMTVLLVTNDDDVAATADRTLRLRDGRLIPDAALRSASG